MCVSFLFFSTSVLLRDDGDYLARLPRPHCCDDFESTYAVAHFLFIMLLLCEHLYQNYMVK